MPPVTIRYEQAVYGSFPFWDRGYAILAHSPGCRKEWLADLRAACQRYGERPAGAAEAGGLMAMKLPSGPWAIVGPCPQGADDRGRPGALAFHALFLSGGDYRKAGASPFGLAKLLRKDWTADAALAAGTVAVTPDESSWPREGPPAPMKGSSGWHWWLVHQWMRKPRSSLVDKPPVPPGQRIRLSEQAPGPPPDDGRATQIATDLLRGRRVELEAPGPIDDLAREVWRALPPRRRARLSLATWTFANGNRHDLAALPRLTGVADAGRPESPPRVAPGRLAGRVAWVGFAAVALAALGLARSGWDRPPSAAVPSPPRAEVPPPRPSGPRLALEGRVNEAIVALATRFDTPAHAGDRPDALLLLLRERLTYRGTLLTPDELARLASSPDADRGRALAWHEQVLRHVPDRPLPDDFAVGPLDWQLRALAWSFHLDPGNRPAGEIPKFLADALSPPTPVRPTPLADRYPALADYARFLRRLPLR